MMKCLLPIRTLGNYGLLFLLTAFAIPAAKVHADPSPLSDNSPASEMIIEGIICEGNNNTDCSFITKKYYQRVGDYVNPEEIADARFRLGTLIQFRNVSARLEKGSRRGYVVVVFIVHEASQIQYALTTSYFRSEADYNNFIWGGPAFSQSKGDTLSASVSRTDFNFLGSGKRFGVIIAGNKSHSESFQGTTDTYFYTDDPTQQYQRFYGRSVDQDYQGLDIGVEYFDPHLLGSSHYYLYGSFLASYGKGNVDAYFGYRDQYGNPYWEGWERHDPDLTRKFAEVEFGRRIGRWSYVSLKTGYTNRKYMDGSPVNDLQAANYTFGSLSYGWNKENDTIFPTQGSALNISITGDDFSARNIDGIFETEDYHLGVDYRKHFNPFSRNVITVGGATELAPEMGELSSSLFARYTLLNSFDTRNGRYSGWHVQLGTYRIEDMIEDLNNNTSYSIQLGYTHQTEKLILKLQAGYSSLERSGL